MESSDMTPVSRTRFSRATRSPLKFDADFDTLPMIDYQKNSIRAENIDKRFLENGVPLKNSCGNKNRCKTCNKVSTAFLQKQFYCLYRKSGFHLSVWVILKVLGFGSDRNGRSQEK